MPESSDPDDLTNHSIACSCTDCEVGRIEDYLESLIDERLGTR